MGGVYDEDKLRARIIEFLGSCTRNGLYRKAGPAQTLDLGSGLRLESRDIEDVVNAQAPKDISSYVNELYRRRIATLDLKPSELAKLRATLLLGLGEARNISSDERRAALARTYRVYVPPGRTPQEGIHQFRDSYQQVARVEREEVIAAVATAIVEHLRGPYASIATVGPRAPWKYEITEAQDDYIYPASAEGQARTVIRKRAIRSTIPALTQFRQTYTDRTPGGARPEVRNVGPGELTIENLRPYEENGVPGYSYDIVITFPPLQRGAVLEVVWLLTHQLTAEDQWKPGFLHRVHLTPALPIAKLSISVRFSPPEVPSEIWRVDAASPQNVLEAHARGDALAPSDDRVQATWEGITLGRTYGIVWRWPKPVD